MPIHRSIAALLRYEVNHSELPLNSVAKQTGVTQPALWRFVNEETDPPLATGERLLAHFGYVVVKQSDAEAAGIAFTGPAANPHTRRVEQRERNAAERTKGTRVRRAKPATKRPKPKR
jgi:hypothetical protein